MILKRLLLFGIHSVDDPDSITPICWFDIFIQPRKPIAIETDSIQYSIIDWYSPSDEWPIPALHSLSDRARSLDWW